MTSMASCLRHSAATRGKRRACAALVLARRREDEYLIRAHTYRLAQQQRYGLNLHPIAYELKR